MATSDINRQIATIYNDMAHAIETGHFGKKQRIGLTIMGSEFPPEELVKGAKLALSRYKDIEIILIGNTEEKDLPVIIAKDLDECHKKMEEALSDGIIDGCVTLHYNFPLGISTVGRVVTPGYGKEMILATTTGISDTERTNGLVINAIYGIAAAKAIGIEKPTVGILNIEGANPAGRKLKTLQQQGYDITFAESIRADGGIIMRGNDLLQGTPDIMVCDTLTGNMLMKVFSSFTTGGSYESMGYGYGPGIGENFERVISIISRASGAPVISNAIKYLADILAGEIQDIFSKELESARKAGLNKLITEIKKKSINETEILCPAKKIVCEQIPGIDVLEIEEAKLKLWEKMIYAETGMGCTGPIIIVASNDLEKARALLCDLKYIG